MFSFWSSSTESKPTVSAVNEPISVTKEATERKRTYVEEEEGEEIIIREVDTMEESELVAEKKGEQENAQDNPTSVGEMSIDPAIKEEKKIDDIIGMYAVEEFVLQDSQDQDQDQDQTMAAEKKDGEGDDEPPAAATATATTSCATEEEPAEEQSAGVKDTPTNSGQNSAKYIVRELTQDELDDEIDLMFVESFDNAFNEFLAYHPDFLIQSPDLVHNLRVTKLQKLLQRQDNRESELLDKLATAQDQKSKMEEAFHLKLKDAARIKAARETHLQSHLNEIHHSTKSMEAQLTWHMVKDAAEKCKTQFQLQQQLQNNPIGEDRLVLLSLLPEDVEFQDIRNNILAPGESGTGGDNEGLREQQEKDMRQLQMDIAFLNAEVSVLQRKLNYQNIAAKKNAWVESILLRMDEETMEKLKARFQRKAGVLI